MSIRPEDAARALKDAEAAADRAVTAVSYQRSSQHLILWGVVWMIANLAGFLKAPHGTVAWPVLVLCGVIGSFIIGVRARGDGRRNYGVQSLVVGLALTLFATGINVVIPTNSLADAEAVMCLAVGAAYMVMGVSIGWRLSAVGAAVMVAVILASLYGREQFFLWMALTGGGGLILGGLWLRKA